ncbi:hypothetical protein OESDEN_18632 [Oesophagostomum dentatum]|uniref:Serine/threonine specific protein phosphatases domain-containing protein n=1 Tax=Oesophagostomum dentatum TaxID=61180 RepID=A0A0B1SES8_OESDE|nr:hypothetical protein OESDEN_18632 [Oesophagostomum dentatum]
MDLLWADPMLNIQGYAPNTVRGVATFFGEDAVIQCCEKLRVDLIVRAHQMMMSGYGFFCNRKLITVFTAPRYQPEAVRLIRSVMYSNFQLYQPRRLE